MKVKDLMDELKKANPEAQIIFATSKTKRVNLLSIYSGGESLDDDDINKESKILYIDLGNEPAW